MIATAATTTTRPARELELDDLAAMTTDELTALYRRGTVPDTLAVLDGKPTCRMLTAVGALGRGTTANTLRALARSTRFPWAGKSFHASSSGEGTGINRVRLAGTREWFPFDTRIEPSAIDGEPCIVLDYDKPENPWFIRKVHDELREVAPGLFLGPAMWKTKADPALVLYFACDHGAKD
jgi:hypothetical protein